MTTQVRAETRPNNWGRWGDEDELGALNLLTPEVIVRAAGLVREGRIYSLSLPIREFGVPKLTGRPSPQHFMGLDGGDFAAGSKLKTNPRQGMCDDTLIIAAHGTSTHMDALCHMWYDDRLYNGFRGDSVRSYGATRCGIDKVKGLITRGLLLDVAGHQGKPHLDPGYAVSAEELAAVAAAEGVHPERGNVVLVRTGWMGRGPEPYNEFQPGVADEGGVWLADQGVVAIGCDNTSVSPQPPVDVTAPKPPEPGREPEPGLHILMLRDRGVYLIEMLDLEALARDRRHEFLFMAAPLQIKGGTNSPINPLAVV
jgi:kynurenine formamidase